MITKKIDDAAIRFWYFEKPEKSECVPRGYRFICLQLSNTDGDDLIRSSGVDDIKGLIKQDDGYLLRVLIRFKDGYMLRNPEIKWMFQYNTIKISSEEDFEKYFRFLSWDRVNVEFLVKPWDLLPTDEKLRGTCYLCKLEMINDRPLTELEEKLLDALEGENGNEQ